MPSSPATTTDAPPARRPARVARVASTERLGPHMLRVVLDGEGLEGFGAGAFSDHYVKLQLPPPGASYAPPFRVEEVRATLPREEWASVRTYSVRDWDAEAGRLTIDVVVHGDGDAGGGAAGPGSSWAAGARPGDLVQLMGPGGAWAPDPAAAWHLLVGDLAVLPAIAASVARLPAGARAHVVVAVPGPEDEQALPPSPGAVDVTWVHAPDAEAPARVLEAVRALTLPAGGGRAFVHGEADLVRGVRTHLVADRGLDRADVHASGYWKRTRTEDRWRDEKAEWVAAADAEIEGALTRR